VVCVAKTYPVFKRFHGKACESIERVHDGMLARREHVAVGVETWTDVAMSGVLAATVDAIVDHARGRRETQTVRGLLGQALATPRGVRDHRPPDDACGAPTQ
jgi:hypothetical protein